MHTHTQKHTHKISIGSCVGVGRYGALSLTHTDMHYYTRARALSPSRICEGIGFCKAAVKTLCGRQKPRVQARRGNSTSQGARPVHQIISMTRWIRTSGSSMKKSFSAGSAPGAALFFSTYERVKDILMERTDVEVRSHGFGVCYSQYCTRV